MVTMMPTGKWAVTLVVISALMIILVLTVDPLAFAYDDTLIHWRIASNLGLHGDPNFNLNDVVMATSSPVWTAILGSAIALGLPVDKVSFVLALFFTFCAAIFWSLLFERYRGRSPSWLTPVSGIATAIILLPVALGSMETPFAMCVIGLSLICFPSKPLLAGAFYAIAVFIRLEMLAFGMVFAVMGLTFPMWRALMLFMVSAVVALCAGLICEYLVWDSIMPNSVKAKAVGYDLGLTKAVEVVLTLLTPSGFLNRYIPFWVACAVICFIAGLYGGILSKTLRGCIKLSDSAVPLSIGATGLLIVGVYFFKAALVAAWYVPLFLIPIAFMTIAFARFGLIALIVCVLILVRPIENTIQIYHQILRLPSAPEGFGDAARVVQYIDLGNALYEKYPTQALATNEIGGLGIGFHGTIIDGFGLVTPDALHYHPVEGMGIRGAMPSQLLLDFKPGIVVSMTSLMEWRKCDDLAEIYRLYTLDERPAFVSSGASTSIITSEWVTMTVLIRRDLAPLDLIEGLWQHCDVQR